MLNKEVDMCLVGKSYLGMLLGIQLLDQDQNVLMLDDNRLQYGELYTNRLCLLEKEFLTSWGRDRGIEPLENIESYLVQTPLTFVFDNIRLRLGDTPARNYRELIRKLPHCFESDGEHSINLRPLETTEASVEFNQAFEDYCSRMGKTAFRYKSVQSLDLESFLAHCPPVLSELFYALRFNLRKASREKSETFWQLRTFFYMGQGLYQKKLATDLSDFELFHLFLCLLSPHYLLDQDPLVDGLIEVHERRGGQFKKTHIREWLFHNGKPWSIELASYDGIIRPKKMSFMGSVPRGMPLKLSPSVRYYNSLQVKIYYKEGTARALTGERIVYTKLTKMGTELPIWEGVFLPKVLEMKVFMLLHPGSKIEFIKSHIKEKLLVDLNELVPGIEETIEKFDIEYGREIWIDEMRDKRISPTITPMPKKIRLLDISKPGKNVTLRNVHYFGPYKQGPLGLLSSLMEINDQQQFM